MSRTRALLVGFGLAAAASWLLWRHHFAPGEGATDEGERRVNKARARREAAIRNRFRRVALGYPPAEIFLRVFKHEADLELWARDDDQPFRLITAWRVLTSSGRAGPKRREGDRQVPEGFYVIDRFNPESSYLLSLGLNYPNASDRLRGDRQHPGSDIFIHGGNRTVGCLPLGDPAIEELYLIALDTRRRSQTEIAVHIFPARMSGPTWNSFVSAESAGDPQLTAFWQELRPAYDAFERTHRVPLIHVDADGAYRTENRD